MKKNIYLLITFILSLFIFDGRVEAASNLTCVYDGYDGYDIMIVQDENGSFTLYYWNGVGSSDPDSTDSSYWESWYNNSNLNYKYNSKVGTLNLTECPKYTASFQFETTTVTFYDSKSSNEDATLIESLSGSGIKNLPDDKIEYVDDGIDITDTEWNNKCAYCNSDGCLYLYYNDSKFEITNKRSMINSVNAGFNFSNLSSFKSLGCPSYIYEYYEKKEGLTSGLYGDGISSTIHLTKPDVAVGRECTSFDSNNICYLYTFKILNKIDLYKEFSDYVIAGEVSGNNGSSGTTEEPNDCGDLLGPELIKLINDIMNVIRIAVPILLIVLGIVDFTKAVFAGDDKVMSEAQSTFIKRIVAAVIVFLVPIFVNLILKIANEVWYYISPETCIK